MEARGQLLTSQLSVHTACEAGSPVISAVRLNTPAFSSSCLCLLEHFRSADITWALKTQATCHSWPFAWTLGLARAQVAPRVAPQVFSAGFFFF